MTREAFKRRYSPLWNRLENQLAVLEAARGGGAAEPLVSLADEADQAEFDRLYRQVCQHLALARLRCYGVDLIDYLNDLALRAHHRYYGARSGHIGRVAAFFVRDFPRAVRQRWQAVAVSTALFVLPALAVTLAIVVDPELAQAALGPERMREMEEMYDPSAEYRTGERAEATDVAMFGFYIMNNVGIAFQTFGSGIVPVVGPAFFLILNGLVLGGVATHLTAIGFGSTFWPFVVGHAAFELTAIVLAGAAGLSLGWSLIAPGRLTRAAALRTTARSVVQILYGVAAMLVAAAVIEAFWSSSQSVGATTKYGVGAALWLATLLYLLVAGRGR